jgi:membrane-associated protein
MKKIFTLLTLCICINFITKAQTDTLTIKIENQYQTEVEKAAIKVVSTGKVYFTNDKGIALIEAGKNDSIELSKEDYITETKTINSLQNNKIIFEKKFTWKDLLTPMFYIINGGLWLLLFIVFAETGLFIGFFLPGDSLLFVAGIFSNMLAAYLFDTGSDFINLMMIISLVATAGIIGNTVGYWFGKKVGPSMYHWKDNFLFKQKYLQQAHDFYEKYGGGAIVFARFLPVVRTFAPIIAGIVQMDKKKFGLFNIIGSVAWAGSMIAAGHYLDKLFIEKFDIDLKKHLEIIILIIVIVSNTPVIVKLLSKKKH